MKKIIVIILIIILTFIIYKFNENSLIDYVSIGDSMDLSINSYGNITYGYNDYIKNYLENSNSLNKYNNYFSKNNYKIEDLTGDILNNKKVLYNDKTYNLKKELREADILTIFIGMDTLTELLNSKKGISFIDIKPSLDNMIKDMNQLIKNTTKLSKTKIILIGYYNPLNGYNKEIDRIFAYFNQEYTNISNKYNIIYVDIYSIIKECKDYLPNKNDYHLTSKGYLKIANKVIEDAKL